MPLLSTLGLIPGPIYLGNMALKTMDFGWSEYLGGQYIYKFIKNYSLINQLLQNNNLKIYLMIFVF